MPRGYRLFVAALVGWVALAASAPNNRTDAAQQNSSADVAESGNSIAAGRALGLLPSAKYKPPCEEPQDHDACDLEAQWKAADAASDAATWAKWSFWLGLASVAGLLYTLVLTRKSTKAAIDTLDSQIASDRPLMQLCHIKIEPREGTTRDPLRVGVEWKIKNFGKTGCWVESVHLVLHAGKEIRQFTDNCENSFAVASFVYPDGTLTNESAPACYAFRRSGMNMIFGTKALVASGHTVYRDPSQRRWRTSFAMLVDMDPGYFSGDMRPYPSKELWDDERVADDE